MPRYPIRRSPIRPIELGSTFGLWTVLKEAEPDRRGQRQVLCRCRCGTTRILAPQTLFTGRSRSCGCLTLGRPRERHEQHREYLAEYRAWRHMKDRCYNTRCREFFRYGARGIYVDNRWIDSFATFLTDMKPRPTPHHSLDRRDPNGPYSPENCRWATKKEQTANRRRPITTHWIVYDNLPLPLVEWARRVGLKRLTLYRRIHAGWSVERALTTPVR